MNLNQLTYFVTLAQIENYTRAAKRLDITQPSLSHAISNLEKELKVPLFEGASGGHSRTGGIGGRSFRGNCRVNEA